MSLYQPFCNGKIGVVDLTTQSAYTVDLSWDALRNHVGGAAMNASASFRVRKRQPRPGNRTAYGKLRPGLGPSCRDIPFARF